LLGIGEDECVWNHVKIARGQTTRMRRVDVKSL